MTARCQALLLVMAVVLSVLIACTLGSIGAWYGTATMKKCLGSRERTVHCREASGFGVTLVEEVSPSEPVAPGVSIQLPPLEGLEFVRWCGSRVLMHQRSNRTYAVGGAGWPFISQYCEYRYDNADNLFAGVALGREQLVFQSSGMRYSPLCFRRVIPTSVYWPGLVGNVLFWWVVSAAMLLSYRVIRARRRIGRTRCWNCNYDVSANPAGICPECGQMATVTA